LADVPIIGLVEAACLNDSDGPFGVFAQPACECEAGGAAADDDIVEGLGTWDTEGGTEEAGWWFGVCGVGEGGEDEWDEGEEGGSGDGFHYEFNGVLF